MIIAHCPPDGGGGGVDVELGTDGCRFCLCSLSLPRRGAACWYESRFEDHVTAETCAEDAGASAIP